MRTLLTCLCLTFATGGYVSAQEAPRLTVEGRGDVAVAPDMATISLSVLREADQAATALDALAEATDAVLTQLAMQQIAPSDIQTGQLSLQPRWDRHQDGTAPRIAGYGAQTVLTVRVHELGRLGAVLDAVVADGANGLDGLRFGVAEPRAGEDMARRAAVQDALAKARVLADAAGLTLGPIVALREGGGVSGPQPVMMEMAGARSMPIAAGEVTQSVTVSLVIELVAPD